MGLLSMLKRFLSARRHPRFSVGTGALVVIEPYSATYCNHVHVLDNDSKQMQMLNISKGGCAFIYNGSKKDLEESGLLSLQFNNRTFVKRLEYVTKSDVLLSDSKDKEKQVRMRGIEFQWLGVLDQKKLKEFIKQNAVDRT